MTTIPLSTVVSYLQRKGVDLTCLEGAPWFNDDGELGALLVTTPFIAIVHGPDQEKRAHTNAIYLGRDAVCPAAMGWAAVVLGAAYGLENAYLLPSTIPRLHTIIVSALNGSVDYGWDARLSQPECVRDDDRRSISYGVYLSGSTPPTPAARLLAVLEYEMGRP